MAEIVNLNQIRKRKAREAARQTAAENRERFGRDKSERTRARQEAERAAKDLDNKRLD